MSLSIEKYRKVLKQWSSLYGESSIDETQSIINKIASFASLIDQDKVVIGLFDPSKFRYVYLSENVFSFVGYTSSKLINDIKTFVSLSPATAPFYPSVIFDFVKNMDAQASPLRRRGMYIGGIRFKHGKSGKLTTIFIKSRVLAYNKEGLPSLGLHLFEDIGHLLKGRPMWCRCVYGENNFARFSTLDHHKHYLEEMVSKRELEILKMIVENKDSKEIGQELGISKDTVLKHRKNMLLKLGAKDSTALIHLCKLCDVL